MGTFADVIRTFSEDPHCWGRDDGIDLVATDTNGKHWAIQAKCYQEDNDVAKRDLDSFRAQSIHPLIHHRLPMATVLSPLTPPPHRAEVILNVCHTLVDQRRGEPWYRQ